MTSTDEVEVVFGKTQRDDEGVVKRNVRRIVFHPDLDFSILVLEQEVPLSNNVKIINLPEEGSDFTGQLATLIGSGATDDKGPFPYDNDPETLVMKIKLRVGTEPGEECPDEKHVCFTSLKGEPGRPGQPGWESGCNGDSGSPFFICKGSIHRNRKYNRTNCKINGTV